MIHAFIKKGSFQDSVSLMLISGKLSALPEVEEVSVMMGTPANKSLLLETGFWSPMFDSATPNDICVAAKAEGDAQSIIKLVQEQLEDALKNIAQGSGNSQRLTKARRYASALAKLPESNLALISIAGEYVAELANQLLDDDRNVMIFSDNVSVADEKALKQKAQAKGLLVMGPDCGTSILSGAPLAFANVLEKGHIGVIGASGTGIQELTSQISLHGHGLTHAIGLGGRDLSADIGGISALSALEMLEHEPDTRVIAFVSKPPADVVRTKIIAKMKTINKPIVALFLGAKFTAAQEGNIHFAKTIDEAARLAVLLDNVEREVEHYPHLKDKKVSGLYTGGTLAAEAAMLLAEQLDVTPSATHEKGTMLDANGHRIVDLGDDFYTVGKPHPMIDPSTRMQEIEKLAKQPDVGVLLLDVVIGYGANPDPSAALIDAVNKMRQGRINHPILVIATVTGTNLDPQHREQQISALRAANIVVLDSLPEAIQLAHRAITYHPDSHQSPSLSSLLQQVQVINIGLRSFAEDLQSAAIPVVHYQWAPVAGGNAKLARLLKKLQ